MNAPAKQETVSNAKPIPVPTHPNVWAAIAAAKGDVKRIAKENVNTDQKYSFASIDDFMAMVGPITAKHGLVTVIDEGGREFLEKPGKYGPSMWVDMTYRITTFHVGGDQAPTVTRHVEVLRTGPQAYGSGQSYVLKQYYRGLLDIPTGDNDDPDASGGGKDGAQLPDNWKTEQQERDAKQERADAALAVKIAITSLSNAETLDALKDIWRELPKPVQHHPDAIVAKDTRKAELIPDTPDDTPLDDELPKDLL